MQKLAEKKCSPAEKLLVSHLLELPREQGDGPIYVHASHAELSSAIGVRSTLGAKQPMERLVTRGLIAKAPTKPLATMRWDITVLVRLVEAAF